MTVDERMGENETPVDGVIAVDAPIKKVVSDSGPEVVGLHDAAEDLGARIKTARESANMTVEEAGELLKLVPETILALESGKLDEFGEKRLIYIEGYYRAYANALDIDVGDTRFAVDHARPIETGTELSSRINYQSTAKQLLTERLREHSDAIIFGLVAVMVLVVGGVIWLVWPSSDDLIGPGSAGVVVAPSDSPQVQTVDEELPFYLREEPADEAESEMVVSVGSPEVIDASGNVNEPNEVFTRGIDQEEEEGRVDRPELIPIADQSLATADDVADTPDETAPTTQETGVIVITFAGPSWVEVYGANDERLYYKMGQDGDIASLVGLIPFSVRIGDASVVTVRFNGVVVDLAPHTFGNVATLTLQ